MSFWDTAFNVITGAFSQEKGKEGWIGAAAGWMEKNKTATHLFGGALMGVGSYFAQQEAQKANLKRERELLAFQSQHAAVPETGNLYDNLVLDTQPNLANGGILTEMVNRKKSQ